MKLKSMKKVLAAVLSTTMVMGMSMTALAADGEITSTSPTNPMGSGGSISAPIFSYDVTHVVVPTSYGVALNPDKLEITVSTATSPTTVTTSTVASKNFGIINKSSKDKVVRVGLNVSSTEPTQKIELVTTQASATNAKKGEYKIFLQAVPADTTDVKVMSGTTPTTPTTATQPASLAYVQMTKATTGTVPMQMGDNEIAFKLGKASYDLKSNEKLNLENLGSASNDVASKYEVKDLDVDAGVTGFTFDGVVNTKANWTKVSGKIQIIPTYTIETADDTVGVKNGTGAIAEESVPKFTSTGIGEISYTAGSGTDAFKEAVQITAPWDNNPYDLTSSVTWANGKITVPDEILAGWAERGLNPTATIKYKNQGDVVVETTATLKTH